MRPIASGVWQLHSARGCNVYAVEIDNCELAIVDCGFRISDGIISEVAEIRAENRLGDVTYILVTHRHRDHVGGLRDLHHYFPQARIVVGREDCVFDEDNVAWVGENQVTIVVPGEMGLVTRLTTSLRALSLPGHTMGSLAYISEKSGVTFTGDTIISHKNALARPLKFLNENDTLYIKSLSVLAGFATDVAAPGHGYVIQNSFIKRLSELAAQPRKRMNPVEAYRIIRGLIAFVKLRRRRNVQEADY
ncbi:MAG: MBL fold metallo-hydrolase [Dehalococcoidia bacterium]|nr:MBL fold metallo-hydrolase [Dehalococcoidia bacterium]